MTSEESVIDAYERGRMAAKVDSHGDHLAKLDEIVAELKTTSVTLAMTVQRLSDDAISRDLTAIATAKALKEADDARRAESERAWSPVQRLYLVLSILVAVVVIASAMYGAFK